MSRYAAAARPKRAGETFARAHHGADEGGGSSKKVKFDVRNPSALAPTTGDQEEEDQVLAADVIGGSGRAAKRGAVNIDGYDSDSDNETFDARAEKRETNVQFNEVIDKYSGKGSEAAKGGEDDDDDEVDMFADEDAEAGPVRKKSKDVKFLQDIEGQEQTSKSGGTVRLDDGGSSDDDEELALVMQEEGIDEEVGLGGLKKHAPKIDAFNMRAEQEEGAFDEAGNFIRKAVDPDAVHDRWMEGVSKKDMKKAAAARERREAELRQQQREDDSVSTTHLLTRLILRLEPCETPLEALARLARNQAKTKPKKVPKWKRNKQKTDGEAAADAEMQEPEDPAQAKTKEAIDDITEAADRLLRRDNPTIYDTERELLVREYGKESGEVWVEPEKPKVPDDGGSGSNATWEFRWTDGRDGGLEQGPFDAPTMKAWQDAGYFGEGVEFRQAGAGGWTRVCDFTA